MIFICSWFWRSFRLFSCFSCVSLFWLLFGRCFKIFLFEFLSGLSYGSRGVFLDNMPLPKVFRSPVAMGVPRLKRGAVIRRPVGSFLRYDFWVCPCRRVPYRLDTICGFLSVTDFGGLFGCFQIFLVFTCFEIGATGVWKSIFLCFYLVFLMGFAAFFLTTCPCRRFSGVLLLWGCRVWKRGCNS